MSESILAHSINSGGSASSESGIKSGSLNISQRFQRNGYYENYMKTAFMLNIPDSAAMFIKFPSLVITASLYIRDSRDVDEFILYTSWACRNNNEIIEVKSSRIQTTTQISTSYTQISISLESTTMCVPLVSPQIEVGVVISGDLNGGDDNEYTSMETTHSGITLTCDYAALILL